MGWLGEFHKRDERGLFKWFKKDNLFIFISKIVLDKTPLDEKKSQQQITRDFGHYETNFHGMKLFIKDIYAKLLIKDGVIVKKQVRMGGASLEIVRIDGDRTLSIHHKYEDRVALAGPFLSIDHKKRKYALGRFIRFDVNLEIIEGNKLYDYTKKLVEISKELDIGVETKCLTIANNGALSFRGRPHIYLFIKEGTNKEQQKRILEQFYLLGKKYWGDRFFVNEHDLRLKTEEAKHMRAFIGFRG